jgi:hypothetical protein
VSEETLLPQHLRPGVTVGKNSHRAFQILCRVPAIDCAAVPRLVAVHVFDAVPQHDLAMAGVGRLKRRVSGGTSQASEQGPILWLTGSAA